MLYLVVERFKDAPGIYRRLAERGRMMPAGLEYISSWISEDMTVCYQRMRSDDRALFDQWIANWRDLMDFDVVPVRTSAEMVELMAKR